MTTFTLMVVLGGCLIGVIQLLAGIAIGMWMRRATTRTNHHDLMQASLIAKRLQTLADEMASSAQEHRSKLDEASKLLTSGDAGQDQALTELVVDVIGEVVRANQDLQVKLDTAESRLEEQAVEIEAHISRSLTDALTGLPNRREFNTRLEERMAAWNRRREIFCILLIDVDHFKKLNDRYGHLAGDQVLTAIGRALRSAVRREDAVARYGGEEFAVLLPATSLDQGAQAVQKVREAIARASVDCHGHEITVTVSAGLAAIEPGERVESLIQRADSALYAAKAAGRNCAFLHNGLDCQLADGSPADANAPSGQASRLVELIASPTSHLPDENVSFDAEPLDFGPYLPREVISPGLQQSCDELRKFLDQRAVPGRTDNLVRP